MRRQRDGDDMDNFHEFPILDKNLQRLIAQKTSVDDFLNFAQTNRMFAALAREEQTWKVFYQRDFPGEYAYLGGELPWFVITTRSHMYVPGMRLEGPGWFRWYMHCRHWVKQITDGDDFKDAYATSIFQPLNSTPLNELNFSQRLQAIHLGLRKNIPMPGLSFFWILTYAVANFFKYLIEEKDADLVDTIVDTDFYTNKSWSNVVYEIFQDVSGDDHWSYPFFRLLHHTLTESDENVGQCWLLLQKIPSMRSKIEKGITKDILPFAEEEYLNHAVSVMFAQLEQPTIFMCNVGLEIYNRLTYLVRPFWDEEFILEYERYGKKLLTFRMRDGLVDWKPNTDLGWFGHRGMLEFGSSKLLEILQMYQHAPRFVQSDKLRLLKGCLGCTRISCTMYKEETRHDWVFCNKGCQDHFYDNVLKK